VKLLDGQNLFQAAGGFELAQFKNLCG